MNSQWSDWDIQRYLLDDPEFHRERIEADMLEDPSLTERVAQQVELLEQVSRVCRQTADFQQLEASIHRRQAPTIGIARVLFFVVAASLLFVVLYPLADWSTTQPDNRLVSESLPVAEYADEWLAMELFAQDVHADPSDDVAFTGPVLADPMVVDIENDDSSTEPGDSFTDDWMLEVSTEFYQELEI